MHSATRRALFGGALRCAGITAAVVATSSTTHADFVPLGGYNFGEHGILDPNSTAISTDFQLASGVEFFPTSSYAGPGGTVSAYAGADVIGAQITPDDTSVWGYADARAQQRFTVSSSKEVLVEWDFLGSASSSGVLILADSDLGVDLAYETSGAGSFSLTLTPGTTYQAIMVVRTGDLGVPDSVGPVFARITNIPSPGALALLGVAGLAFGRRRRG